MNIYTENLLNLNTRQLKRLFIEIKKEFGGCYSSDVIKQLFFKIRNGHMTGTYGIVRNGHRWIWNTAEEWSKELDISTRHFHRIIKRFVDYGLIMIQKFNSYNYDTTNHYTICFEKLAEFLPQPETPKAAECHNKLGQNVRTYIQNNLTKDINKSDGYPQVKKSPNEDQVELIEEILNSNNEKKEEPSNTTSQDMLSMWIRILGHKSSPKMSKELAPLLVAAFNRKFLQDLKNWSAYCELIKSSNWMMGDSFNLDIMWALKFSTIDRILGGELGVKYPEILSKSEDVKLNIEKIIKELDEPEEIKLVRRKIAERIGSEDYYSWFHPAKIYRVGNNIQMKAANSYAETIWNEKYNWAMKDLTVT